MKILIVKLSAFGDIIHALPALDDLRARPEISEVHWLVDARYAFVTELFPTDVTVHTVALRGEHPVASVWQAIKRLRNIGFDAVIDLQGLIKSALLARAAGSPVFGIDRNHLREPASRLFIRPVCFHADERHVVQQYRRVAMEPFFSDSRNAPASPVAYAPPRINLAESGIRTDKKLLHEWKLADQAYVLLHAAGGWETKQLPDATWLAIAHALHQSGKIAVFSWGSANEQTLAQRLASTCNGFALPERLNMSALCAVLQGAQAIVGADTGVLHLAAALNVPTITFWGPSASWRSAPLADANNPQGDRNWHIQSNPACGPCFKRRCDHFVCMDAIDPEAIIRILHEL